MNMMIFETPLGTMALEEEDGALVRLRLPNAPVPRMMCHETPLLAEGIRQISDYFAGKRTCFDLPLNPEGTLFQKEVWKALGEIPQGEVRTYGEIAAQISNPKATQAIGMACNRNPLPILIPCHRVVGKDGKLVGYAGGVEMKGWLLELERRV